jgi:hypothetical protein
MASIFEVIAGRAIGYPTGLGGAVTQSTSKATGVTLSKPAGEITTHDASLAGAAEVSFVVTNTFVGINDVPVSGDCVNRRLLLRRRPFFLLQSLH